LIKHIHEKAIPMSITPVWARGIFTLLWALSLAGFLSAAEPAASAPPPVPSLEQRVASLEAYLGNGDPDGSLKNSAGVVPAGATSVGAQSGGPGHNAWVMISAALVFFMTLPGLALFYGGLVRVKNVLSIMAWCLGITSLVCVLWWAVGYSLVFGKNFQSGWIGGSEFFFFQGVGATPNRDYSFWVSHQVFAMFQLMFAIITPAVVIGAVVERMKFSAVMVFAALWLLLVYCPLAHMVWGATGLMNGLWNPQASIKAIDFAGGLVVEMASGWSALVLCLVLGPRAGFGKTPMPPHSLVLCVTGTGLLWFGWYGFNAGSALAADGIAGNAFATTTFAAAVAAGTWAVLEYFWRGQASVLGFCSGAVAGLVGVTPACGYITTSASVGLGLLSGAASFLACTKIKSYFKYDDALDVFGVHGVAGTLGMLFTGIFAHPSVNANLAANLGGVVGHTLWREQLKGMGLTALIAVGGTAVIAFGLKSTLGLRASKEMEQEGLDQSQHGEQGYIYDANKV
jgi:ammonium transporter, Amt family